MVNSIFLYSFIYSWRKIHCAALNTLESLPCMTVRGPHAGPMTAGSSVEHGHRSQPHSHINHTVSSFVSSTVGQKFQASRKQQCAGRTPGLCRSAMSAQYPHIQTCQSFSGCLHAGQASTYSPCVCIQHVCSMQLHGVCLCETSMTCSIYSTQAELHAQYSFPEAGCSCDSETAVP